MEKQISKGMFGLFFEDINYGLDGGLHAEMLENRSFEFLEGRGYSAIIITMKLISMAGMLFQKVISSFQSVQMSL